jgi:hypothetical protein
MLDEPTIAVRRSSKKRGTSIRQRPRQRSKSRAGSSPGKPGRASSAPLTSDAKNQL